MVRQDNNNKIKRNETEGEEERVKDRRKKSKREVERT